MKLNKKAIIPIIVTIAILTVTIGYTFLYASQNDSKSEAEDFILSYTADIMDVFPEITSSADISNYIYHWGQSRNIDSNIDDNDNVIFKIPSENTDSDKKTTVFHCSYNIDNLYACLYPISLSFYLSRNTVTNNDLVFLFTNDTDSNYSGLSSLNTTFINENTEFISLTQLEDETYITASSQISKHTLSSATDYIPISSADSKLSFEISLSGVNEGIPDKNINNYPNPINELGAVLAAFKNSSFIFELANIQGGTDYYKYPESATMTVVIHKDHLSNFTDKMNNYIEDFVDDNIEEHPSLSYSYTQIDMPSSVLSKESTDNLVSKLYINNDGVYEKNEDDKVIALTSIGRIYIEDNQCVMEIASSSLDSEIAKNIHDDLTTVSELISGTIDTEITVPLWYGDVNSELISGFKMEYDESTNSSLTENMTVDISPPAILLNKGEEPSSLVIKLDKDNIYNISISLVNYLNE